MHEGTAPISNGSISSSQVRIQIHPKDARVHTEPTKAHLRRGVASPPLRSANSTSRLSRKSKRNLAFRVRNVPEFSHFLTLSYGGDAPNDDKVVKKHLNRINTWLVRQGVSFVWRQDWTKSGHVHFHMLLSKEVDLKQLRARWQAATGKSANANFAVHMNPIRNQESVRKYLIKPSNSRSNFVPDGYKNMGRFWGARGPQKPKVEAEFLGSHGELAPLLRVLRRLSERSSGKKIHFLQPGARTSTLWSAGGAAIAEGLSRYWQSLREISPADFGRNMALQQ